MYGKDGFPLQTSTDLLPRGLEKYNFTGLQECEIFWLMSSAAAITVPIEKDSTQLIHQVCYFQRVCTQILALAKAPMFSSY